MEQILCQFHMMGVAIWVSLANCSAWRSTRWFSCVSLLCSLDCSFEVQLDVNDVTNDQTWIVIRCINLTSWFTCRSERWGARQFSWMIEEETVYKAYEGQERTSIQSTRRFPLYPARYVLDSRCNFLRAWVGSILCLCSLRTYTYLR